MPAFPSWPFGVKWITWTNSISLITMSVKFKARRINEALSLQMLNKLLSSVNCALIRELVREIAFIWVILSIFLKFQVNENFKPFTHNRKTKSLTVPVWTMSALAMSTATLVNITIFSNQIIVSYIALLKDLQIFTFMQIPINNKKNKKRLIIDKISSIMSSMSKNIDNRQKLVENNEKYRKSRVLKKKKMRTS